MDFMPLYINMNQVPVLIVGGGKVALKKAQALSKYQALITIIALEINSDLYKISEIRLIKREFMQSDISNDYFLVIAATDKKDINDQISEACLTSCIPCVRADLNDLSTACMPTLIDKDPIFVSLFGGGTPEISKMLKKQIEQLIDPSKQKLAKILKELRPEIKQSKKADTAEFIAQWVNEAVLLRIKNEGSEIIKQEIKKCL